MPEVRYFKHTIRTLATTDTTEHFVIIQMIFTIN